MIKKLKQYFLNDQRRLSKVLFVGAIILLVTFVTDLTALATQNSSYGYGYGASGYGYGYGYWTEATPTLAFTYASCTSSCSVTPSTALTITATFGSTPSGTPQIKVVEGTTTTLAFTNMSGSGATWTYAYTTGSAAATATVSVQTLGGSGYTPTPSNATFTIASSSGGGTGGSGGGTSTTSPATISPTTTTTTTTPTTTSPTTVTVVEQVVPAVAAVKDTAKEKEGLATYMKLTNSLPIGDGWKTVNFIAYGTTASVKMSVNDRKGIIGDYQNTYGRVPKSDKDWTDVNLILNSKKPTQRQLSAEQQALKDFVKTFKKLPNFKKAEDELGLYYIAYKIRAVSRDLTKEKAAITKFKKAYGVNPKTSGQWAIMRAIAYSGIK